MVCFLYGALTGFAQDDLLQIGNQAPPIKYSKWVKGEPITEFKDDKLYVMEFWATWCGPCIAAMPHLSELAHKYEGKISFVAVNVWEKIGNKPYESVIPTVSKFVEDLGEKMDFNVVIDNNDQFMSNEWLIKAGVTGIPSTFLIQKGKLIWIGHPKDLESIINEVQNGTYDMNSTREEHLKSQKENLDKIEAYKKLMKPIDDAIAAENYEQACKLMNDVVAKDPSQSYPLGMRQFKTRLEFISENNAMEFAKDWVAKDGSRYTMYIAQTIADYEGLSKDTYAQAAIWFQPAAYREGTNPMIIDYLAKCYFLAGNYPQAVEEQKRALKAAKDALEGDRFTGIIVSSTVEDYQNKLKTYSDKLQ
ncbi:TlpA disulfide reductase family protein [Aestuariibaculum marinum]|uniref:TlpA family protein disulfide reductase n=1 Tax=Aestuariibaculum marinum TaxID=2683592 RepID=A0A8J6Q4V8_9FLAO|nr:TlpA disulfide reductase family protein [Aestuariibaculum marinum]MBD0825450.1 TlpA family protein disulfide reductase [Aestuariibaculum marinum]